MRERKQCFSAQKVMFYDSQSVGLSLTTDYTDFHRVFLFAMRMGNGIPNYVLPRFFGRALNNSSSSLRSSGWQGGMKIKNSVLLRVLCGERITTNTKTKLLTNQKLHPLPLAGTPPIIMVFASVLRKNRFIKVISFNDSKHSCYYLGP